MIISVPDKPLGLGCWGIDLIVMLKEGVSITMIGMFGVNKVSYDLYYQYIMISATEKRTSSRSLELCWNISRENDSVLSQKTRDCKPGRGEERGARLSVSWYLEFINLTVGRQCCGGAFIRIFQSVPGAPPLPSRNILYQNRGSLRTLPRLL